MLNLRLTINNIEVPNYDILDKIKFSSNTTSKDLSVGDVIFTIADVKFRSTVNITYGDVVKITIIDENKEIPYGTYLPYEIKKNEFSKDVELYAEPVLRLMQTYVPLFKTNYSTRSLLIEMMNEFGFDVKYLEFIIGVNMDGTDEEWSKARTGLDYLSFIGSCQRQNVLVNRNNQIEFKLQNDTNHALSRSQVVSIEKGENSYFITGVEVQGDNSEKLTVGDTSNKENVVVIKNPFIKSATIANNILNSLSALPIYEPCKVKYFDFEPTLDILDVVHLDGQNIPIMNLNITFGVGGLVAEFESTLENSNNKSTGYTGSISSRLEIVNNLSRELDTRVEIMDGKLSTNISQTEVLTQQMVDVNGELVNINGELVDINGDIVNINGDIIDINGDIVDINGDIANINGNIVTIRDKQSSFEQDLDSITTRVSQTEINISTNYYTKEQVYTKVETNSQIEQTATQISQTITKDEVGKLSVGARNFILKSNVETTVASPTTTDNATYTWSLSVDTPYIGVENKNTNTTFSLSIWCNKSSNAFTSVIIGNNTFPIADFTVTQQEQSLFRYIKKFDVAPNTMLSNSFVITILCQGTLNHSSIIKFLQLEEGSLATSYQQPLESVMEDFDAKLEDTIQDIVNGNQEIQNTVQDILSDDFISDSERADLVLIFKEITAQYNNIMQEVADYGEGNKNYFSTFTNNLTSSFNAFSTALSGVINNNDTSGKVRLQELLATYYDNYHKLLYVISQFVKSEHEKLQTEIIQTNSSITNVITRVDNEIGERKKFMEFNENGLQLFTKINGQLGAFMMVLSENRLSFYENGSEVAYMSNNRLFIKNAEITTSLQIGDVVGRKSSNNGFVFVEV